MRLEDTATWKWIKDRKPIQLRVLDIDKFIQDRGLLQVTSHAIHEASSATFDPDGLFSEEIFGLIGSTDRLINFGYIELNAEIIQPPLFDNVIKLSALYGEILAGKTYAIFDPEQKDFIKSDLETNPDAQTGYSFFLSHIKEIEWKETGSDITADRIATLKKYQNVMTCKRMIVSPAGIRDIDASEAVISEEDVNKLYTSLLAYTFAIPAGNTNDVYDVIRYNIQKKAVEIYDYYANIFKGKRGFGMGAYGRRKITWGTRNVITSANFRTLTPDHPQALDINETKIGIYQTIKGLQPVASYYFKTLFINTVMTGSNIVPVINKITYDLEYIEVPQSEIERFTGSDAIESLFNRFKNPDIRLRPLSIEGIDNKEYYLHMVYDTGDEIVLFRSMSDLTNNYKKPIDPKFIRPLTYLECFYMTGFAASQGKHCFVTRYPAIESGSCYPSRVHLASTTPSRMVYLVDLLTNTRMLLYPEYPILNNPYHDSVSVHPSRLAALGADYDGDMISVNFCMADDSNAEIARYLDGIQSFLNTQLSIVPIASDPIKWTLYNFSKAA